MVSLLGPSDRLSYYSSSIGIVKRIVTSRSASSFDCFHVQFDNLNDFCRSPLLIKHSSTMNRLGVRVCRLHVSNQISFIDHAVAGGNVDIDLLISFVNVYIWMSEWTTNRIVFAVFFFSRTTCMFTDKGVILFLSTDRLPFQRQLLGHIIRAYVMAGFGQVSQTNVMYFIRK